MSISLITHPILSVKIVFLMISEQIMKILTIPVSTLITFFLSLVLLISPFYFPNPYSDQLDHLQTIIYFCAYWILLGVASSIGLGTGLHTFVLYLGPHIAKTVMTAHECNGLPIWVPNRYQFSRYQCPSQQEELSFIKLISIVQLESMLWGLGTALGELPPYFVARAASRAKSQLNELDEIDEIKSKSDKSFSDRIKITIFNHLQRHAFITVLLCASIPNPLFDLAGITCGHFQIPFVIFFTATSIGKAIIKTHIQMIFVIVTFSKNIMESMITQIESLLPFYKGKLVQMFEKQKAVLISPQQFDDSNKPLISVLWDYFIAAMIFFFIYQTINALVQDYYQRHYEEKDNKKVE